MNPQLIKKMQKMQKDMMTAQKEIEGSTFTGKAGGGMVVVEVMGTKLVKSVKIDPEAIEDKEDIEMLQDTIVAAMNDAMNKIDETTEATMGEFTKGMPAGLF